jgi:hypothetical protein
MQNNTDNQPYDNNLTYLNYTNGLNDNSYVSVNNNRRRRLNMPERPETPMSLIKKFMKCLCLRVKNNG